MDGYDSLRPMNRREFFQSSALVYGASLSNARAQGTSAVPNLTIREIRAVRLRDGFNSRFVRVYTDQGLTGTGETMDTVGAEDIVNPTWARNWWDAIRSTSKAFCTTCGDGRRAPGGGTPSPLFMRGMGGPYFSAMSGVEMALWDLAGKAMNVPVYRLMGGRVRDKVPVYLHAASPDEAARLMAETKVKALKIGIDYSPDAGP